METRVNYAWVGFFVLTVIASSIFFVIWLTSGETGRVYQTYLTCMHESVSGLNIKASVKYNGVVVGYVKDIQLDPDNPSEVNVFLYVDQTVALHTDARATLQSQGLTGIACIELKGGSVKAPLIKDDPKYGVPVIKSKPSLMITLDTALRELLDELNMISIKMNSLLQNDNQEAIRHILSNLDKTTGIFAANNKMLNQMIQQWVSFSKNTNEASRYLPEIARETKFSLNLINQAVMQGRDMMESMQYQMFPQTTRLLQDFDQLSVTLDRVFEKVERNPSVLIRGEKQNRDPMLHEVKTRRVE